MNSNEIRGSNVLDERDITIIQRSRKFDMADVFDVHGNLQGHIVSTTWLKVIIVAFMVLLLCGIVVLGMVIYNRTEVQQLRQEIQEVK